MIKKYLLGLGISIITFLGFSNGIGAYQPVGINLSNSAVNSGYSVAFHKGGGVFTSYLGQGKSVLALDKDRVFWWTPNGFPYVYLKSSNRAATIQGFFDRYYACDEFGSNNNLNITNCSLVDYIDYSGDNQYIKNQLQTFFSTINSGDYGYYKYVNDQYVGATYDYYNNYIWVCFSSHSIGQSICFMGGYCYHEGECNGNLINSQGIQDLSYGMISPSWVGYAPGQNGYDGNRDNEENNTNNSIINVGSCPTIGQLMQNMGENYNTGLCYNNTTYFNGTEFEQVEKQDIFTIFNNDYQEYTNRISIYRNNCRAPYTTENCQNAFNGEYKKYSIISNAINNNAEEKKLRNYCNFGLNYNPNTTTCVASGSGIKEKYTNEEVIESMVNNGIIVIPGNNQTGNSNNVLNSLKKCDDGDRNCYVNNRNFIDSLGNIYSKITGLFKEREGVNGIIPDYILRITFLTILITVIFKK